jgi:predicted metal-binding membrane protein
MRINSFGWAVIVLAVTLTVWNVMEYHQDMAPPPVSLLPPDRWDAIKDERRSHVLPRYVEREVLIIGGTFAAWLIVGRRKP